MHLLRPAARAALLLFATLAAAARAQSIDTVGAGLEVFPTRLVLDDRTRTAQLSLVNRGNSTSTYRLGFQEMEMTAAGELRVLPPGATTPSSAAAMIRYSPRQVTLKPGEVQTVRLMVREPAELPGGEYRSHLQFRAVPSLDAGPNGANTKHVSVQVTAVFGISIPVIVRHGDTRVETRIEQVHVEPGKAGAPPVIALQLDRTGNRSTYGDLAIVWLRPDGTEQPISLARGLAVYPPNPSRPLRIAIPKGTQLHGGRLRVQFTAQPEGTVVQVEQPLG